MSFHLRAANDELDWCRSPLRLRSCDWLLGDMLDTGAPSVLLGAEPTRLLGNRSLLRCDLIAWPLQLHPTYIGILGGDSVADAKPALSSRFEIGLERTTYHALNRTIPPSEPARTSRLSSGTCPDRVRMMSADLQTQATRIAASHAAERLLYAADAQAHGGPH